MDTYEGKEDLNLEQLKIYPMKTLALEERPSSFVKFHPYNPDLMQIKVNFWKSNIIDEFPSLIDYIET